MEIRPATLADIIYIDSLRKHESEAIGFIPKVRYEMEINGQRGGSIILCLENDEPVGFVYATHNRFGVTHIQQVAVQRDARRLLHGKSLIDAITRDTDWLLSCRCAADLESTDFWKALGFGILDHVNPKSVYGRGRDKATLPTRRKRDIIRFQKVVGGLMVTRPMSGVMNTR